MQGILHRSSAPAGLFVVLALLGAPSPATAQQIIVGNTYVEGGEAAQQLDLYVPAGQGFATVVFVHGGSLTSEARTDAPYPAIAEAFQRNGVACANIDYRLGPENAWPAMPMDVAAAVAWVHGHIASYGGDPDALFLVGHSSGGHLTAIVSTDPVYLGTFGMAPGDLAGAVPIGSKMDMRLGEPDTPPEKILAYMQKDAFERSVYHGDPAVRADASPILHVGPHVPPTLLLCASEERFHPPILEEGAAYIRMLQDADVDADLLILPGRTHMQTIRWMPRDDDFTLQAILSFIKAHKPVRDPGLPTW